MITNECISKTKKETHTPTQTYIYIDGKKARERKRKKGMEGELRTGDKSFQIYIS